jgi:hypothetical protein
MVVYVLATLDDVLDDLSTIAIKSMKYILCTIYLE